MKSIFNKKNKREEEKMKETDSDQPVVETEAGKMEDSAETGVNAVTTDESNPPKQDASNDFENLYAVEKDKYLRLYADFENYKRRNLKERMELLRAAGSDVIINLLPVLDDFERAIKNNEHSSNEWLEGIKLIYIKFKNSLEQKGLKEMNSIGEEFNPELHEAISKIKVESTDQDGKVIDVLEKGYYLNDKIIRHARVVVGEA